MNFISHFKTGIISMLAVCCGADLYIFRCVYIAPNREMIYKSLILSENTFFFAKSGNCISCLEVIYINTNRIGFGFRRVPKKTYTADLMLRNDKLEQGDSGTNKLKLFLKKKTN